jgi:hypothetical protein
MLFGFSFFNAATYVLTRAIGVSLFMARMGSNALPLAFVASAVAVIAISLATRLAVRRIPAGYCATVSWLALAGISLFLSIKIVSLPFSLAIVGSIYMLAEVRGCLNTVYVTALANDMFAHAESKKPFVLVSVGAPVAGIVAGLFLSIEAAEVSATTWLSVIAGLDMLTMLTTLFLPRVPRAARDTAGSAVDDVVPGQLNGDWRKYRYGLAALVSLKVIVLTLVSYQWTVVVNDYLVSEQKMIAYFAAFYAISDIFIVLVQIAASGKLLDRFGIGMPLMLYPLCLSVMGLAALVSSSLTMLMVVFTLGSGLNVLRRSIHDPGLTAAYAILDPSVRSETIVLVKGMIKPFAEGVAALGLLFYADVLSPNSLTLVWVALLAPWYFFARWVSRRYSRVKWFSLQ